VSAELVVENASAEQKRSALAFDRRASYPA